VLQKLKISEENISLKKFTSDRRMEKYSFPSLDISVILLAE
jgi:hypothetical protein